MENKNFTLSPAVTAYVALIVVVLGVGLVVTGYDIRTSGVTAQQALLSQVVPVADDAETASELTIHYPEGWEATALDNGYIFNADEDDATVQIVVDPRSYDQLATNYNPERLYNDPKAYKNPLYSELAGSTYTVSEGREPGEPEVLTDVVVLELPDGRSLEGRVTANANAISRHRKTLNYMLDSLEVSLLPQITLEARDSVEPLALTQTSADNGTVVNLSYPDGWTAEAINDGGVYGLLTTAEDGTSLQVFLLSPAITGAHLGVQTEETTPEVILSAYQGTLAGSLIAQSAAAGTFGEANGARLLTRGEVGTTTASEHGVFEYSDGLYLSYVLTAEVANLQAAVATADAILQTVEHNPLVLGDLPARDTVEPLPFAAETATLASAGVTFNYPDGWTTDASGDPVLVMIQGEAAPIQFLVGAPDLVVQAFSMPAMEAITPQAIADVLVGNSTVAVPVAPYTIGDYTGVSFAIFGQVPPGQHPDTFNVIEVGILELPTGDYVVSLISSEPANLPQLQATTDAILANLQLEGVEASTETDTEADTGETDTPQGQEAPADETSSEGETESGEGEAPTEDVIG